MQLPVSHEEAARRKKAIEKALESHLTNEQMLQAIMLCDHEFVSDPAFSATSFCQRLVETLPSLQLSAQARLELLRMVRQNSVELGVQQLTSVVGVPRKLLQAEPKSEDDPSNPMSCPPPKLNTPPRWTQYVNHPNPHLNLQDDRAESSPSLSSGAPDPSGEIESKAYPLEINNALELKGHYWIKMEDTPTGDIAVTELTAVGITFQIQGAHTLQTGQQLSIEFALDDQEATSIWQNIVVNSVTHQDIEATWRISETLDDALKRYLIRTQPN